MRLVDTCVVDFKPNITPEIFCVFNRLDLFLE